jgi:hypothetical protein
MRVSHKHYKSGPIRTRLKSLGAGATRLEFFHPHASWQTPVNIRSDVSVRLLTLRANEWETVRLTIRMTKRSDARALDGRSRVLFRFAAKYSSFVIRTFRLLGGAMFRRSDRLRLILNKPRTFRHRRQSSRYNAGVLLVMR